MSIFFRTEQDLWPGQRPRFLGSVRHRIRYGHWPEWTILYTAGNKLICTKGGHHDN